MHMDSKKLLVVVILVLSNSTFGAEVDKEIWIDHMTTALPTLFCNPSQYFRQCFNVSAEQCEEVAVSAARICLDKNRSQIPNTLVQPEDGNHWGTIIGRCAGCASCFSPAGVHRTRPRCAR